MDKTIMKYFFVFLILISIQISVFALETINPDTLPTSPVEYSPGASYQFNITCNNSLGETNAWLTFDGIDYATSNENDVFYTSLTDLAGGSYEYNFTCNDTVAPVTSSTWSYDITQAPNPISLVINDGTDNIDQNVTITYGTVISATGTANGDISLYRDGTDVTDEIGQDVLLGAGTYAYNVTTIGNENYTASESDTYYVIVNKASPIVTLLLDGNSNNLTVDTSWVINITAISDISNTNITLNTNLPGWVDQSGTTTVYSLTEINDEGVYNITAFIDETLNYSSSSVTHYLTVSSSPPECSIVMNPANNSYYSPGAEYQFNITCQDGSLDTVLFTFNGTDSTPTCVDIDSNTKICNVNKNDLAVGTYNFTWFANDSTGNYTNNTVYNVIKATSSALMVFSPSASITYGTTGFVNCSKIGEGSSAILTLYRNNDQINSNLIYVIDNNIGTLAEATYNYTCAITENQNYTSYYESRNLAVSSGSFIPNQGGGLGGGDDDVAVGKLTVTSSDSDITLAAGSSKVITFTLTNTYTSDISDTELIISGISAEWYSLDRQTVSTIRKNGQTETVKMTLNIPSDAELDSYQIKVKASGQDLFADATRISFSITIDLHVTENVPEVALTAEEVAMEIEESAPENETESGPTGFLPLGSEIFPYLVMLLGGLLAVIIFVKRDAVTSGLMQIGGTKKAPKKTKGPKETKKKSSKRKFPSLGKFSYKLAINVKKEKKPKTLEINKDGREKELEREIKQDIKELQNILESEKRIKKRKK